MGDILTRGGGHPAIVGRAIKIAYTGDGAAKAQQANGISQPEKPVSAVGLPGEHGQNAELLEALAWSPMSLGAHNITSSSPGGAMTAAFGHG